MKIKERDYIKLKLLKKTLDNGIRFLEGVERRNITKSEMELLKREYMVDLKKSIETLIP